MTGDNSGQFLLLNRLAEEFAERYRRGERPLLQEYIDRHPELAQDIREFFPAMAEMEQVKEERQKVCAEASPSPALKQLGDFRIIREVGKGGMGIVYEAEQVSLGRHVALKVLPKSLLLDAKAKRRFEHEAKAAAKLHHTNIVPVFGVGEQDGMPYYVMQFIQGLGLDEVLDELKGLSVAGAKAATFTGAELRIARNVGQLAKPIGEIGPPSEGGPVAPGRRDLFGPFRGELSAAQIARSLLTCEFQPSSDPNDADPFAAPASAGPEGEPGAENRRLSGQEQMSTRSRSASSDSLAASSSSVVLPGQSRDSSKAKSGKQTYWHSVARIGVQVAEALEYAHKLGVLHRDIKPSNLLLDTQGTVWVTDFGLAKADDQQDLTHTGDILGTVRYMPPEAFESRTDRRGDVYSLGLTLYELLALRPAFEEKDRRRLIKLVTTTEPQRLDRLNSAVPRDLVTIVHKAIDRDPAHRYSSATDLAGDLQHFIDDEPIKARRQTQLERYVRWARRNPGIAVLGGALTAVLVLVSVASLVAAGYFNRLRLSEAQAAESERQARQQADQALAASEKSQAAAESETYHAVLSEVRALRAGHEPGWRDTALGDLARLAVMPTPRRDLAELRTEAAATLGTPDVQLVARISLSGNVIGSFTFSPDGQTLVTADRNTGLNFWDVPGKRYLSSVGSLMVAEGIPTHDKVVYLHDGTGLAVATDQGVVFTDPHGSVAPRAPITQGSSKPTKLVLSDNGRRMAVAWTGAAGITVHDTASGELLAKFNDAGPAFVLSADGKWLARRENAEIVLLPIGSSEPRIVLGRQDGTTAVALSPNGAMLAAAFDHTFAPATDLTTVLWDVAKREQLGVLRGHRGRVADVAFSPDGEWIATGSYDYTTRIWEARTGQHVATLHGSSIAVFAVRWSPTGEYLAVSDSLEIFLFKIAGRHRVHQWLTGQRIEQSRLAAHPRQERLATSGYSDLNSWDLSVSHPSPAALGPNPGNVTSLAYSDDGSLLAIASGEVLIRDSATAKVQSRFAGPSPWIYAVAFDADCRRLASGDIAGNVILWNLATSSQIQRWATGSEVRSIVFLDPHTLVTHGRDALLFINVESGKVERKVDLGGGGIRRFVVDRTRGRLVVGFENGSIGSVSLPDLTSGPRLEHAHEGGVEFVAHSSDGRLVATLGADRRVELRDPLSFETLLRFPLWDGTPTGLTFDFTGRRLAIVSTGQDIAVWDLGALRDGLTEVGLAWDLSGQQEVSSRIRSAPAAPHPALSPDAGGEGRVRGVAGTVPVIRRPGAPEPAVLEETRRLLQSGVAAFQGGQWTEAIRVLEQARDRLRILHQFAPGNGQVASALGISLGFLGGALRNEHRPAEAWESFKESGQVLEAIRQPTAVDLYNLACAYSNLSALVEPSGAPPSAAEREALAQKAIATLRRSLAAGMTDFAAIDRDHDLDPIRERADFRALMKEFGQRPTPK